MKVYLHLQSIKVFSVFKREKFYFNLDGSYIKEWDSLKDVIMYYNMSGGNGVRKSIKNGQHCKGYLWSYENVEKLNPHLKKRLAFIYTFIKKIYTLKILKIEKKLIYSLIKQ